MKVRRKPLEADAVRFVHAEAWARTEGKRMDLDTGVSWHWPQEADCPAEAQVITRDGLRPVRDGDWIITYVNGQTDVLRPGQFAATFARVGEETAKPSDGIALIAAERERQVTREGWSIHHDNQHRRGEIARAAACYALSGLPVKGRPRWPWAAAWWKPKTRIRDLVRAGALIAAEIDRLRRNGPDVETTPRGRR